MVSFNNTRSEFAYNRIEISRSRLMQNAKLLRETNPAIEIAPVLKSNAYGHGIDIVGPMLDTENFPFLCVNSLFEANILRESGVKTDILIMGYVATEELEKKQYDYIFAIFDLDQAKILHKYQHQARVHINVETGLHRDGIDILTNNNLLEELKTLSNLHVEGLMSHLACSNDPACPTTSMQLKNFKAAKELVSSTGFNPKWFHLGGSLALLNSLSEECNVVRCGKAFFGIALNSSYQATDITSSQRTHNFQLTLTLKTKIAQVKQVKKGDHIGYADSRIADRDMIIGILPIGYYDGIDRRMTNKGVMQVGGVYCGVLGVVAMNVTTIDLTNVSNPHIGQDVIIYSDNYADGNSLDIVAKLCGTLPQDLLLHLPVNLKREIIA